MLELLELALASKLWVDSLSPSPSCDSATLSTSMVASLSLLVLWDSSGLGAEDGENSRGGPTAAKTWGSWSDISRGRAFASFIIISNSSPEGRSFSSGSSRSTSWQTSASGPIWGIISSFVVVVGSSSSGQRGSTLRCTSLVRAGISDFNSISLLGDDSVGEGCSSGFCTTSLFFSGYFSSSGVLTGESILRSPFLSRRIFFSGVRCSVTLRFTAVFCSGGLMSSVAESVSEPAVSTGFIFSTGLLCGVSWDFFTGRGGVEGSSVSVWLAGAGVWVGVSDPGSFKQGFFALGFGDPSSDSTGSRDVSSSGLLSFSFKLGISWGLLGSSGSVCTGSGNVLSSGRFSAASCFAVRGESVISVHSSFFSGDSSHSLSSEEFPESKNMNKRKYIH